MDPSPSQRRMLSCLAFMRESTLRILVLEYCIHSFRKLGRWKSLLLILFFEVFPAAFPARVCIDVNLSTISLLRIGTLLFATLFNELS